MTSVTLEIEIASHLPADKIFKAFTELDKIVPKAHPQYFKSIDTVEGDGGAGTKKVFTFGDAVPFTTGTYKTDAIDLSNHTYSYTCIDGDVLLGILDSATHHVKVVPSADGGCVYKQTVIYNCKGSEKPTEETLKLEKEIYTNVFKTLEAHAIANP